MNKDGKSEDEVRAVVIMSHKHTFTSFQTQQSGKGILGENCPGYERSFVFSITYIFPLLATANFTKKSAAKKRIWDAFLFKIR
jgi:hypothetical protein